MGEKKICSIEVAMEEPMFKALKGFAEADGTSAPELIRMMVSTYLDERRTYYARLNSIFGDPAGNSNESHPLPAR